MANQKQDDDIYDISVGGLIARLLVLMGVRLGRWQLAFLLLAIVWLPLAVMTAWNGTFYDGVSAPFLRDYARQGRLLLGVPLLIVIHSLVYSRMPAVLRYISDVLLSGPDREFFINGMLRKAKLFSGSIWIQLIMLALVLAVATSPMGGARFMDAHGLADSWIMPFAEKPGTLSAAGRWMQYVSIPVFQFLLIRWVWRYAVWVLMLYRISRLNMNIRPTHPDGAGGLAVLMLAQRNFVSFFFVCGIVISSSMIAGFALQERSFDMIKTEIFGFILFSLSLTIFPLLFFTRKLVKAKYLGQLLLGKAGSHMGARFEDKWVNAMAMKSEKLDDIAEPSNYMDYTGVYRYLQDLSIVPFRFGDIILMALVLFLPFVPIFFMRYSIIELLEKILGLLV